MENRFITTLSNVVGNFEKLTQKEPSWSTKMIFLRGGPQNLAAYYQTPFLGVGGEATPKQMYMLAASLRRFGCPLVAFKSDALPQEDYPGILWITIKCSSKRLPALKAAITKVEAFRIQQISGDVYVLIGEKSPAVDQLIEELFDEHDRSRKDPRLFTKNSERS